MFSLQPLTARIAGRLRPPKPLMESAARVVELEPGSRIETKPAIALAGELERVTDFVGDKELHRHRLEGGERTEGPTLSYEFDDALIADFTVYAGGTYQVYRPGRKRPVLTGHQTHFDEAQICTTVCAQMYFGHFFHDGLPLEELAAARGVTPVVFERDAWLHEPGYRTLVERHATAVSVATVGRFSFVDERHLNEGWIKRFEVLRSRIRSKVPAGGPRKVFITRGKLFSGRSLANEPQLANMLEQQGFVILEPEHQAPEHIATVLRDAELVVVVAGSAEVHALLALPAGATLVEIQIAPYFGTIGKLLADSIQLNWAYVVAEASADGFTLEPARLLRTLDLVA